jgi:hypothetical protein
VKLSDPQAAVTLPRPHDSTPVLIEPTQYPSRHLVVKAKRKLKIICLKSIVCLLPLNFKLCHALVLLSLH